ncbi:MAG: homoserine kinase [Chromatiales bacterium]|nr:homoserine kinase [Chromatiales bacterium]
MANPLESCTARAPGSVGNVAVGFDILGHAFDAVADLVTARRSSSAGVRVMCSGPGSSGIPLDAERNTAGKAALAVLQLSHAPWGVDLEIIKGIPVGSGLGGSGASAVAGAVAVNGLLETSLTQTQLLDCALDGEEVATGARVIDNVAASLLGGLVFAVEGKPPLARSVAVPDGLYCALVHPDVVIATEKSRAGLSDHVSRCDAVRQMANLAGVIVGCEQSDFSLLGRFLRDVMIEPQRFGQVRGFHQVQEAAMEAGALGCSLSGSGPSIFAWCQGEALAGRVATIMSQEFSQQGIGSRSWVSKVDSRGAQVTETL